MCQATRDGANGYSPSEGHDELKQAAAEKEKRVNGIDIDPSRIIATTGVSEAIQFLAGALIHEGSELLVPGPTPTIHFLRQLLWWNTRNVSNHRGGGLVSRY